MSVGEITLNTSANLQALYHLSNTTDSSANGYTLTNNGTVTFPSGKFGNAANFVAASSQSLTATLTNANVSTSQTWLMWTYAGSTGGDQFLMGFRTNGGSDYKGFYLHDDASQQAVFNLGTTLTPNEIATPNNGLVKNRWSCWIGVYNSSANTIKLFIDGILKAQATTTGSAQTATASFGLGRWGAHVVGYYQGMLDECAIWTRAWSDREVKNYYAWARGQRGGAV